MFKSFRKIVEPFGNETTLHGINHIGQRKASLWPLLWTAFTGVSIFFALQGCYRILLRYLANPTSTDMTIITSNQSMMQIPYPGFCTDSLLNPAKLDQFNVSSELRLVFDVSYKFALPPNILFVGRTTPFQRKINEDLLNGTRMEYEQLLKTVGVNDFDQFLSQMALQCTDFVLGCTLNTEPIDCCTKSILKPIFGMQRCFFLDPSTGSQISEGYGLEIMLLFKPLGIYKNLRPWRVFNLFLTYNPEKAEELMPFNVETGKSSTIFITYTSMNAVKNLPKYDCNDEPDYNRADCFTKCYKDQQSEIHQQCQCLNPFHSNDAANMSTCDPWEIFKCPSASLNDTYCVTLCPLECKRTTLTRRIETVDFDPETVASGWNMSVEETKQQLNEMATIMITHESSSRLIMEQQFTMSIHVLLSDIGGQLGFFVGASLLSIIHVLVFMVERLIYIVCGIEKKKTEGVIPSKILKLRINRKRSISMQVQPNKQSDRYPPVEMDPHQPNQWWS